jgi:hypothetical protein
VQDGHEKTRNRTVDIHGWIGWRGYARYGYSPQVDYLPFFGHCPQPEELCFKAEERNQEDTATDGWDWAASAKELTQCRLDIDQFVVLHWPLPPLKSRDLCGNTGFGTDLVMPTTTHNNSEKVLGSLTAITFRSRRIEGSVTDGVAFRSNH